MTLDISKYRVNVPMVATMMDDKTPKERIELISAAAVATMCPVIAICYFTGELYGFWPELEALIERLKTFYRITEIIR